MLFSCFLEYPKCFAKIANNLVSEKRTAPYILPKGTFQKYQFISWLQRKKAGVGDKGIIIH